MGYPGDENSEEVLTAVKDSALARIMGEIRELAPVKRHHLAPDMVNGSRKLTVPAAQAALLHLKRCPDAAPQPPAARPARQERDHAQMLPPTSSFTDIPDGYYATPSRTGHNDCDFYQVKRKPKWPGRIFIDRVLGGGDGSSLRTENMSNMQDRMALLAIREYGPDESAMLFAAELKRCRACGLPLTDQVSRDTGMGPTCRAKKN